MRICLPDEDPLATLKSLSRFMCTSKNWKNFVKHHFVLPMTPGTRHPDIHEETAIEKALLSLAQHFTNELQRKAKHKSDWLSLAPTRGPFWIDTENPEDSQTALSINQELYEYVSRYVTDGTLARMPLVGGTQIPPDCEDHRKFKFDLQHRDSRYRCSQSVSDQVLRYMAPGWVIQLDAGFIGFSVCSLDPTCPQYMHRAMRR